MKPNCVVEAWHRHEPELRGYLTRQLGDPAEAEDLLQTTFVKAIAEGAGFCQLDNPRAWLFRVARNLLIDRVRRHRDTVAVDDNLSVPEEEIPAVESLAECLPHALQDLDTDDREAITLCDLEGMTQADYAAARGLSLPGAKSRVQRARKRLKQVLQDRCQVRFDEQGAVCCYAGAKDSPKPQ